MSAHQPHRKAAPVNRRDALRQMGAGFGSLGLASMLSQAGSSPAVAGAATGDSPLAPKLPHFPSKAKHVIQLFMPGGNRSQVGELLYRDFA